MILCLHIYPFLIGMCVYRSGSSVGIATDYGLEGPGSNSGEDKIFHRSRPTLGTTKFPVK